MSFSNSKQTQTLTFEFSHLARFSPFSAPVPPRLETVRPLHGATEQFRRTLSLQLQHAVAPEAVPSDSRPSLCIFVFQVLFLLHFQIDLKILSRPVALKAIGEVFLETSEPSICITPGPSFCITIFNLYLPSLMGKMHKNRKQAGGHGTPREETDMQEQEMDIRKIMKDVENFSYSHMSWKERKKIENRNVVSLGGKPQKNQRLPLSVARPMMKKQKEREQKMLQERLILGQFGGKLGGSSKRSAGKHKPENRGLKSSEGHFRNGILNVKHLLNSAPSRDRETGTNMSNAWKGKGGKKKNSNKGGGKKHR
ncbi:hypothetical protein D0Y65_000275 [Glycine soja]|nr:hypothetical protein D0Y65_000275 [Glycine soja]